MIGGVALATVLIHFGWTLNPLDYLNKDETVFTREVTLDETSAQADSNAATLLAQKEKVLNADPDTATNKESLDEYIASFSEEYPDSLLDAGVKVATDVLLFSRNIKIEGAPKLNMSLDSVLLDDRSGKKNAHLALVEFWKSPINYKGYKWDTRKLVLFGFETARVLRIRYLDGDHYLLSDNDAYKLEISSGFRPMIYVESSELLSKLRSE
jgi:hypothetical protein